LDGHSGFWQILLRPEDREKTAFRTPFGNYKLSVMDMGLTNAPATYQRLILVLELIFEFLPMFTQ
jgi:hypothetical protein